MAMGWGGCGLFRIQLLYACAMHEEVVALEDVSPRLYYRSSLSLNDRMIRGLTTCIVGEFIRTENANDEKFGYEYDPGQTLSGSPVNWNLRT